MKKITAILLSVIFTLSLAAQDVSDENSIKKIIEEETLAFANADLETWSGFFVHEPYLRWTVSPTMSFDGWEALYNGAKSFLESQPGRSAADELHKITRENWIIRITGDMAWVKFMQTTEGNPVAAHQFRVLERAGGIWRIAMLVAVH